MNKLIDVQYKWNFEDPNGDLVCTLTKFMDLYLLREIKKCDIFRTYLYNDLNQFEDNSLTIAFRVPGATRGHIELERVNNQQFRIKEFIFYDSCEGEFACYDPSIRLHVKDFIGDILDFSHVHLQNNLEVVE